MNQVITDVPFGDGDVKLYLDTSSGKLEMESGELETPDLTLTTDYDTAKKIFVDQDQAAGMQAFMSGKIKVQGDMTKLMMMNATPQDEEAKSVAAEIKEMAACPSAAAFAQLRSRPLRPRSVSLLAACANGYTVHSS